MIDDGMKLFGDGGKEIEGKVNIREVVGELLPAAKGRM